MNEVTRAVIETCWILACNKEQFLQFVEKATGTVCDLDWLKKSTTDQSVLILNFYSAFTK